MSALRDLVSGSTSSSESGVVVPPRVENFRGQFDLEQATDTLTESYVRRLADQTPMSGSEGTNPPISGIGLPSGLNSGYLGDRSEGRRAVAEPRAPIEINYTTPLVVLDNNIDRAAVLLFRAQARTRPSLITRDVIMGVAQIRVKLALSGDASQKFVREEEIES